MKPAIFLNRVRKFLKVVVIGLIAAYVAACVALYFNQKSLLFPVQYTKPVNENWRPSAGVSYNMALINGRCGKLHVARWNIANAKGTIMMFHGNGESLASIDEYVFKFHQLGFNLMAWDYPGYGRSTDCWFSEDDLLHDADQAYHWLAKLEKPENIIIFGYSMGTGLAIYAASKHAKNPVFLVAAYDSLLNLSQEKIPFIFPTRWILRYPLDTQPWLANISQPIYMMHGAQDQLIHPSHAKALWKAAKGKAHLEMVEAAGHADDVLFNYRNQWMARLLKQ